jgi:Ser/Thr protein kinase RdoA (MazF antagonist)
MDIFPAQYSTLSANALKGYIEKAYGISPLYCRLLVRNVSDTYILEHGETKFIFKIYRHDYRALDEIKGEAELLNILKAGGIPVSYPIADLSGNEVQQFSAAEGVRHGLLFSFAEGKVVADPDREQLRIIGHNVALMHNITSVCQLACERPNYNIQTTLVRPLQIIQHRFTGLSQQYAGLVELAEKVTYQLSQYNTSVFSFGYCHYDLLAKNFHFDDCNQITFFDFDWCICFSLPI